ncbi:MAG: type I-B CRISPR-associated protein Cas5b [Pyrinomonadaceae bacterium]|nr:type I-B CRISPR-associated protein Cas5b [Pyrinomonadaceae bacterium]
MKLLHAKIVGWTATFRMPLLYSGTGLTAPVPPYSTILGFIGNLAAREIKPHETRIGYIFKSSGLAIDMETTQRLKMSSNKLSPQEKGIVKRQFHLNPALDIYLDNLDFQEYFENPRNVPSLGRSQDLVWIEVIKNSDGLRRYTEIIEAESVGEAKIGGTLLPFPQNDIGGQILNLPEYFYNDERGHTRCTGKTSKFVAVKYENASNISRSNLFKINDSKAVYMHSIL